MNPNSTNPNHTSICPKCGYDQSGEIATWKAQCPVRGRCVECGTVFAWGDVFHPHRNNLRWYVEHVHEGWQLWQLLVRTPGTAWRLIFPYFYWRWVGVESEVRLKPLAVWLVLITMVIHLTIFVVFSAWFWFLNGFDVIGHYVDWIGVHGARGVLIPIVDFVLGPYYGYNLSDQGMPIGLVATHDPNPFFKDGISPLIPFLGMTLGWMGVMLGAPSTRRMAKLRACHVYRAGLLSMFMLVLVFESANVFLRLSDLFWSGSWGYINRWAVGGLVVPIAGVWLLLFWAMAVGVGWRIERCRQVIVLGSAVSVLSGVVMYSLAAMLFGWG